MSASGNGTDLGLYSVTFNNDLDADIASLEDFTAFRSDARANRFRYFLEVFNPNTLYYVRVVPRLAWIAMGISMERIYTAAAPGILPLRTKRTASDRAFKFTTDIVTDQYILSE